MNPSKPLIPVPPHELMVSPIPLATAETKEDIPKTMVINLERNAIDRVRFSKLQKWVNEVVVPHTKAKPTFWGKLKNVFTFKRSND